MAHCVHMKQEDIDLLKRFSTSVSHCPISNIGILSGLCPVRNLINNGLKVGLGTGKKIYIKLLLNSLLTKIILGTKMCICSNFKQMFLEVIVHQC